MTFHAFIESSRAIEQAAMVQFDLFGDLIPTSGFNPYIPSHLAVVQAILKMGALTRKQVDEIGIASNGPQLMADIGKKDIHWTCEKKLGEVEGAVGGRRRGIYKLTPLGIHVFSLILKNYYSQLAKRQNEQAKAGA